MHGVHIFGSSLFPKYLPKIRPLDFASVGVILYLTFIMYARGYFQRSGVQTVTYFVFHDHSEE